jgi:ribosomal protein S18 acetylase RimI-like enzyme
MSHILDHALDRPVWSALTTRHASLSQGGALAKRYDPTIIPFAAARDDSAEALQALAALPKPGKDMLFVQADAIVLPPGFVAAITASGVQMILKRPPAKVSDPRIEPLSESDAAEMLQLATLTKPGPFTLRAQALGRFFGVKIDGRLAAMAGERMKQEGFSEVSGVCTHPDFQGRGLARLLSVFVTHRILERGETPYLHAYATNGAAIGMYESIGYELRTMMKVAVVRAEEAAIAPLQT